MTTHLILPDVKLEDGFCHPAHAQYLKTWHAETIADVENGVISASACLQAALTELTLEGKITQDWISIMDDLLTDHGRPIAYSEAYSKRLYKFDAQFLQSTIHSLHTRWWIECWTQPEEVDHEAFANHVAAKKQTNGLIYDFDISETTLRHRMKSELTLSAAMAAEILAASGKLNSSLRDELATALTDPKKVPPMGYMTCEQFRLHALRILQHEEQFPTGIGSHIEACAEGLEFGWSDFCVSAKVDAYMGTAKRVARDKAIPSPLVACHVAALKPLVEGEARRQAIAIRLSEYAMKLKSNPLDIPAFQMRDVCIPFGAGLTPIEAIAASWLTAAHT